MAPAFSVEQAASLLVEPILNAGWQPALRSMLFMRQRNQRSMKKTHSQTFVVAAMLLVVPATIHADESNIVHIIADELGWNDFGYHGSEIKTPHLEAHSTEAYARSRMQVF